MTSRGASARRRRGVHHRERRGVALLLVLWLVALLAIVTVAASGAARSSGDLAGARRAQATAQAMAESGIVAALTTIGDSLRALGTDSIARDSYLNALDVATTGGRSALGRVASDTLGDAAFAVAVVDVAARLDVNEAGEEGLTRLLRGFTTPGDAQMLAARIAARVRGDELPMDSTALVEAARDSLVRALLGQPARAMHLRHPFASLDELSSVPGVDTRLLMHVAPLLTVDGDARVNRRSAPPAVLAAATGTLVDAPSRLLLVARGWQIGHPLTHEIQAVYDVSTDGLRLVRWREQTL